ncbi:hypothetical protein SORBI_3002G009401 [Sorghum bicolor]|uniref:F-box domain-containing protein n=1 Tax=Sorghum bicolor TaxID=4558 RepID=A0A1W0W1U4_SORBI|nr:hypothetical protein SORBI_3002G009401 [Sorghum bicolor]
MDELVEEILLRIPPDDPTRLLRAALVCKRWCRIVSAAGFRLRFREFHRTPPILGFLHNHRLSYTLVSTTSSFRPPPAACPNSYRATDARHGRVLLSRHRCYRNTLAIAFVVWDPIRGQSTELPLLPSSDTWNAAVLCAAVGACDHLDCQHGPEFLVVFVGTGNGNGNGGTFAHVYSSEAAAWSKRISAQHLHEDIRSLPSALAGNALYFVCSTIILKYDLAAREMSRPIVVRTTEDGGLGLASIRSHRLYLHEWSIEDAGWVQSKVIKLTKLLPDETLGSLRLTGFAHGLDIILVAAIERTFTIDLKSLQVTKVCEEGWCYGIFPYMSFCNPGSRVRL